MFMSKKCHRLNERSLAWERKDRALERGVAILREKAPDLGPHGLLFVNERVPYPIDRRDGANFTVETVGIISLHFDGISCSFDYP